MKNYCFTVLYIAFAILILFIHRRIAIDNFIQDCKVLNIYEEQVVFIEYQNEHYILEKECE